MKRVELPKINIPKKDLTIYVLGSLKNRELIIPLAKELRKLKFKEVFDSWISPGPEADDFWRDWAKERGLNYKEALAEYAATHVFEFDNFHINRADIGVMCMPCGKSGHLELGTMLRAGKRGYILFDKEPERWDVMHQFADKIFTDKKDLIKELKTNAGKPSERDDFCHATTFFNLARRSGLDEGDSKTYVRERMQYYWEGLSRKERGELEHQYTSLMELIK
ncbi:hypothetical protein HN832_00640 [archaeon]|jgi:hypothetical protein|nr:hypothetical protein [archaeon]MBT4373871.1 hypothetical protein [archaeon]MBT4532393.1 hypothetical protein [archaeon]MBT7001774.1 hypothetical protein [archaeon]MBT7281901.1 hypothetical protein [archaeon]